MRAKPVITFLLVFLILLLNLLFFIGRSYGEEEEGAAGGEGRESSTHYAHHNQPVPTELGKDLSPEELLRAKAGYQQPALYPAPELLPGEERYLRNIRQITFGGENAEAYWSPDGRKLTMQCRRDGGVSDQIYVYDLISGSNRLVSTGKGVATCSFWMGDGRHFIYASTHIDMPGDPPTPDYSKGYVWSVHPEYEIYLADSLTGEIIERLTDSWGYDAECEGVDWGGGDRIVFTSARDGDLDLYAMDPDTKEITRLTDEVGYDGGSFPSYDGSLIVWRRQPEDDEESRREFKELLSDGLVRPNRLELWIMNSDGSDKRQLTENGAANFGPNIHPDNMKIIFASNLHNPGGRNFDLFLIPTAGGEPVRVTFFEGFDGLPMFSPDGKYLVFASNRNSLVEGETNIFIAEWTG